MIIMNFVLILNLSLALLMLCAAVSAQLNFTIGDNDYFTDVTSKINREDALQFCKDQGAELAKITDLTLYYQVLINLADAEPNIYWVDGIYYISSPNQFYLNNECTYGSLDLDGVPYEDATNLCLAIERGENARANKLRSLNCTLQQFVLCSRPVNSECCCRPTEPPTELPDTTEEPTTGWPKQFKRS